MIEVTLSSEQWDEPAPDCPSCAAHAMQQQFRPVAITGSPSARAHAIVEDIADKDYHVADMTQRKGEVPKVRYKDQVSSLPSSTWSGISAATLEQAMINGRQTRLNFGSGLDVLQANIKSGKEPDLIALSKKRAMRVY